MLPMTISARIAFVLFWPTMSIVTFIVGFRLAKKGGGERARSEPSTLSTGEV